MNSYSLKMRREHWWWPTYLARKAQYVASECGGFDLLVLCAVVSICYFVFRDFAVFRRNFGHNFSHFWAFRGNFEPFLPFFGSGTGSPAVVWWSLRWFRIICGLVLYTAIFRGQFVQFRAFFGSLGPFLPFLGSFSGSLAVVWWSMLVILPKLDMN